MFRIDGDVPEYKTLVKTLVPSSPSLPELLPLPVPAIPRRGSSHHSSANTQVPSPSSVHLTTEPRRLGIWNS